MLRGIWWEVFHALWGNNKDLIYDKQKWMEFQRLLDEIEQDINILPIKVVRKKYLIEQ